MFSIKEKVVSGAYYIVKWDEPTKLYEEFQDCWEVNENGVLSKISIQLLYNSESRIVNIKPKILSFIEENKIKPITLKISDFFKSNTTFDNVTQILYKDSLLFTYVDNFESLNLDYSNTYKLTNDLFVVFDNEMTIKCIIINNILSFNYLDIGNDFNKLDKKLKIDIIKLYFRIYTYDQYSSNDINNLINDIDTIIHNNNLDKSSLNFFLLERENLQENL